MIIDGLANMIDLSRLNELRSLILGGLIVPISKNSSTLEESLPSVLQRIDSPFLNTIELRFLLVPDADLQFVPWEHLERVLLSHHFFGMRSLRISVDTVPGVERVETNVGEFICRGMPELHRRGVLTLQISTEERQTEGGSDGRVLVWLEWLIRLLTMKPSCMQGDVNS